MADFVNAHLALTTEGLWVLPNGITGGGFKVLIATGGTGHTYPNAGTYIIGASGPVAYFGSSGIELKGLNFSNVLETYCRIQKDDTFLKAVKYVGTGAVLDYTQTTQITEDGFVIERKRGSGTSVKAFEVTADDPDAVATNSAGLLLQGTRDSLQRYPEGGSVKLSTDDGEGVVLGYWLNGNFTETARMDNDGGITVTGDIWADGNIEADGNINCNGNMSPAGDLVAGGSVEDGNGNVLADKADASSIPTKTSDLTNDGDGTDPFITSANVPTATSELTNDGDGTDPFATTAEIPTATSELTNDGDGTDPFATTADLASKADTQMVILGLAARIIGSAGSSGADGITLGTWKLCWGSYTTNTSNASGSGTFTAPYYVNENISLSFSATPYVWAQVQGSLTGSNYALVTATSTTGATIRLMSSHKNTTTRTIRWFAIGQA